MGQHVETDTTERAVQIVRFAVGVLAMTPFTAPPPGGES
jgi:hypothetical protein